MRSGGQTTVIQRILEKRAQKPPEIQEDTSATIAVMLRVLPPPRALLVFEDSVLLTQIEDLITSDILDTESAANELDAVRTFSAEFRPIIITDNLELIYRCAAPRTSSTSRNWMKGWIGKQA